MEWKDLLSKKIDITFSWAERMIQISPGQMRYSCENNTLEQSEKSESKKPNKEWAEYRIAVAFRSSQNEWVDDSS